MSIVSLQNVSVDFPIYNNKSRSIKNTILSVSSGGRLKRTSTCVVIHSLKDISFSLKPGERVGLVGRNGAGKSTLLRTIAGVYEPTRGYVNTKGKIGSLVDISLGIDKEATGRENIYIRGALLGLSRKEIDDKIDEIVEFSELGDFIEMPVRTYSSGMHLRLAFAVATVIRPDILLMDEWLSVGDAEFNKKARLRLTELIESSKILIIASHSRKLIEETCNRALWIDNGMVKMDGAPKFVCDAYWSRN